MAQYSDRLSLILPDLDDPYDIGIYNDLVELLDRSMVVGTGVGAVEKLTEAEYAALPMHSPTTLYAVKGENTFRLMLGELGLQTGGSFPSITDDFHRVEENMLVGTVTDEWEFARSGFYAVWDGAELSGDTSQTVNIKTDSNGYVIAVCMHRDPVLSISGTGWTKIIDSVKAFHPDGDVEQWITIWGKPVRMNHEEAITVTQAPATTRMQLRVAAFYGLDVSVSVVGNEIVHKFLDSDENYYTPVAKDGKRRLYLLTSIYANSTQSVRTINEPEVSTVTNLGGIRFCLFLDYDPTNNHTPQFNHYLGKSYQTESAVCLTLDITVDGT